MSEGICFETDRARAARQADRDAGGPVDDPALEPNRNSSQYYNRPLISQGNTGLGRGRNSPTRALAMQSAQHTHGNRAVQRLFHAQSVGGARRGDVLRGKELSRRIEAASGTGNKLDLKTREKLEESLEADLSDVRVHTGPEADRLSRSVGAVAFTTGNDIFFRDSAYNPGSSDGLRVLAHEIAHTVQQAAGPVDGKRTSSDLSVSSPTDRFEQAAWRAADDVVAGRQASKQGDLSGSAGPGMGRQFSPHSARAGGSHVGISIQRIDNPPPEWWDQAYDDPTPEEMEELERMYQKGLAEDAGGEAVAEGAAEGAAGAEGAGWLASFMPFLPALGAGAAVMTYSSTSIVGDDEEKKMLEESRRQQAAREAAQANTAPAPAGNEEEDEESF